MCCYWAMDSIKWFFTEEIKLWPLYIDEESITKEE